MRIFFFFFFLLLTHGLPAQSHVKSLTIAQYHRLKKIPTQIGEEFTYMKNWNPEVSADEYFFEFARIGKIKLCKIRFTMQEEKIDRITIHLGGSYFNKARKQAQKEFGRPKYQQQNKFEQFTWTKTDIPVPVEISLYRHADEWGSEMTVRRLTRP
jgi:hypothetical protein